MESITGNKFYLYSKRNEKEVPETMDEGNRKTGTGKIYMEKSSI